MGLFGASRLKTLLTSLVLSSVVVSSNSESEVEKLPICENNLEDLAPSKNLLFVSTLDGKVTALDARDGTEKWHLQVGNSLLSSSIHRVELSNAGKWFRLVPSLGGSLYRFNGDSLEPLPLSADQLLSSSRKFSDDLVIAGGKETAAVGVSTRTGKVAFECSLSGCVNTTGTNADFDERILITRVTQTVRALEPRTGHERWNFSVGQHELLLQPIKGCILPTGHFQNSQSDLTYRVVVPEGLICAVERNAPHNVVWKHKLDTPIVGAWNIEANEMRPIDLFGAAFVPSWSPHLLPNPPSTAPDIQPLISPAVYIGMHDRQLYIQESVRMQALVQYQTTVRPVLGSPHDNSPSLVLPWKPVPARSPKDWEVDHSMTALSIHEQPEEDREYSTTSLSVLYASDYVNGNGYYLYSDHDRKRIEDPTCDKHNTSIAALEEDSPIVHGHTDDSDGEFIWADDKPIQIFVASLWFWWKEVAVIAISTAICLNLLSNKLRRKFSPPEVHRHYVLVERKVQIVPPSTSSSTEITPVTPPPFYSRYESDFSTIKCLGHGGFGIVYEAKNNIDECHYAVKRITLPNKKDKREKVLREVRALAKLDHSHIVRYFHAWLEEPPPGWQDPFESELKSRMEFTETYSKLPTKASMRNKASISNSKDKNVCLSIEPEVSEYCKSLASGTIRNKSKNCSDFNRQRSYSESFSIVFEKSSQNRSPTFKDDSFSKCDDLNESAVSDDESSNDSYIVFANSESENKDEGKSAESVISISDNVFQMDPPESGPSNLPNNANETQIICINEIQENMKSKKGHRRNLSLDLNNMSNKNVEFLGKMYLYIQMQLCQPQSLRDWLRLNTCPDSRKEQVVTIFEQIVQAVEYVHLQGLIHRDLKPSNIFFASDGRIKVGDFGLVTAMVDPLTTELPRSPILGMPDRTNDKHTQHVGTHLYMSPEQLRGEAHGYKVDIWSLGLVLAELLIPFGTDMERILTLKALRDHKFPKGFDTKFPQEHSLLRLMLSQEPHQRPSTLGVRARAPLLHSTDPKYHFTLPPRSTHTSTSSN